MHGKTKPHDSIFHAMLERIGVTAATAVMVGDDPGDDVEGARAIGMQAILVDREERPPRCRTGSPISGRSPQPSVYCHNPANASPG